MSFNSKWLWRNLYGLFCHLQAALSINVIRNTTPCSPVETTHCFGGSCCLHLQYRTNCYSNGAVSIKLSASHNSLPALKPVPQIENLWFNSQQVQETFLVPTVSKTHQDSNTCTPPDVFMAFRSTKYSDNFTLFTSVVAHAALFFLTTRTILHSVSMTVGSVAFAAIPFFHESGSTHLNSMYCSEY